MSSTSPDLTPQARIRQAAVELFGEQGFGRTSVRQIAERAGVSAPLVIHHFGSKDGLRLACDEWVIAALRQEKAMMALGGGMPTLKEFVDAHPEFTAVMAYLLAGLREGGAMADRIFDLLHATTTDMMAEAEKAGIAHLPDDREAAIAFLVASSCGLLLMQHQFARRLGGASFDDPQVMRRYALAATDLYTDGLFTPDYRQALAASIDQPPPAKDTHE